LHLIHPTPAHSTSFSACDARCTCTGYGGEQYCGDFFATCFSDEVLTGRGGRLPPKCEGSLELGEKKGELMAYEEFVPARDASPGFQLLRAGMEVEAVSSSRSGTLVRILCGVTKASEGKAAQKKFVALVLDNCSSIELNPLWFLASLREDLKVCICCPPCMFPACAQPIVCALCLLRLWILGGRAIWRSSTSSSPNGARSR
jgi:hypothetical protein